MSWVSLSHKLEQGDSVGQLLYTAPLCKYVLTKTTKTKQNKATGGILGHT